MNIKRYSFNFLKENDSIEPNYDELYYTNFTELYNRASNIFTYKNLPETIPDYVIKKLTMIFGRCFFLKKDDKIIVDKGNNGGYLDGYHRPLTTLIINPYFNINQEYQIYYENNLDSLNIYDENVNGFELCGILRNDSTQTGLYNIISKYAYLLTHAEISLSMACINSRSMGIATGVGEKAQKELQVFYENLLKGKIYTLKENIVDENTYKILPFVNNVADTIQELINLKQFYFAEFLNEIGIKTNINQKKAQQNSIEIELTDEISNSLVDEMFNTQKADLEIINNLFNLNIEIEKNYTESKEETQETETETEETKDTEDTEDTEKGVNDNENMG